MTLLDEGTLSILLTGNTHYVTLARISHHGHGLRRVREIRSARKGPKSVAPLRSRSLTPRAVARALPAGRSCPADRVRQAICPMRCIAPHGLPALSAGQHRADRDHGERCGPNAGGEAVIHYTEDQRSFMRLPGGQFLKGRWTLSGDGYKTDWEDGPKGHWHIDHAPGLFAYVDGGQQRRGVVSRIVPGDPEAFAG